MRALQAVDARVIERRHVAVLLRRQALEPGLARVHDERIGAGRDGCVGELVERRLRVLLVDADAALDRDRHRDRGFHRRDAVGDERRLAHQAGAEAAVLHPVGRAADVEVDLVIAEIRADARRSGEVARIGAAELQRDRMLRRLEAEQARARRRGARRRS